MGSYRVISSDSHVFEPPDLWTSRTEPKFKDRAPYVIHRPEDDRRCRFASRNGPQ